MNIERADRAKVAELLGAPWAVHRNGTIGGEWESDRVDAIAAALADARAEADQLRDAMRALAAELEADAAVNARKAQTPTRHRDSAWLHDGISVGQRTSAARVRDLAGGGRTVSHWHDDELREAIIGALIDMPVVRDYWTVPITPRDAHLLADAVLPVVTAWAECQARER